MAPLTNKETESRSPLSLSSLDAAPSTFRAYNAKTHTHPKPSFKPISIHSKREKKEFFFVHRDCFFF